MSNVDVQDKVEVPSVHSVSRAALAQLWVRRGLGSAQLYRRSIFDLGSSQLRTIKASFGVSTDATLAFWL